MPTSQVRAGVVDGNNLRLALRYMMQALGATGGPKMAGFAVKALLVCREAVGVMPQYCQHLLQVRVPRPVPRATLCCPLRCHGLPPLRGRWDALAAMHKAFLCCACARHAFRNCQTRGLQVVSLVVQMRGMAGA